MLLNIQLICITVTPFMGVNSIFKSALKKFSVRFGLSSSSSPFSPFVLVSPKKRQQGKMEMENNM